MPRYSVEFDPPAPVVGVVVYCPVDHHKVASVSAELDSGADVSVVPQRLVDELHLVPRRVMVTQAYDGAQSEWATYMVDLEIEGCEVRDVEVIALPRSDAVLGRDVLNSFTVTLDGKALTFEIVDP